MRMCNQHIIKNEKKKRKKTKIMLYVDRHMSNLKTLISVIEKKIMWHD